MEKTQKILKRFISLILTFAISFGSYVFPVFAALPEDNEAPTVEEVVAAYDALKTQGKKVADKIDEISSDLNVSAAKLVAIGEAQAYLDELNETFKNTWSDPIEHETLKVITTEYNVITVIVDFKLQDLGITLTNETMKQQVLKDTYSLLQNYYYELEFVYLYLEQSKEYTALINEAGSKFETISSFIEKLDELEIAYDEDLYGTYAEQLATLMIADDDLEENTTKITKLINDLTVYDSSIKEILKNGLKEKFTELKDIVENSSLEGIEIDTIKSNIGIAISALDSTTYDLKVLSDDYIAFKGEYNALVHNNNISNPTTEYIDSVIADANKMLENASNLNITVEQVQIIQELINDNSNNASSPMSVESLTDRIENEGNLDLLSEKLISGELNYEILAAYADINNNHGEMIFNINQLYGLINGSNSSELAGHLDVAIKDIYASNGGYMDRLNSIKNDSQTDDERLQILNKLDLIKHSLEVLKDNQFIHSNNDELVTPITDKIAELKEKYSKSCENRLTSLVVNGIEMDVTKETYKVYVGNDVTEIKVLFEQTNKNSKVEVLNADNLKVGTNEVIVIVTAENGDVRQYTIEVIRAEAQVVTTTEVDNNEAVVTPLTNNTSNETVEEVVEEETKNTSDSATKYNEEIEEEGLSALTVFFIVVGIAFVGYGVYKIFGEKEDKKIDKAFEQPKANKNKPTPKKKKK